MKFWTVKFMSYSKSYLSVNGWNVQTVYKSCFLDITISKALWISCLVTWKIPVLLLLMNVTTEISDGRRRCPKRSYLEAFQIHSTRNVNKTLIFSSIISSHLYINDASNPRGPVEPHWQYRVDMYWIFRSRRLTFIINEDNHISCVCLFDKSIDMAMMSRFGALTW